MKRIRRTRRGAVLGLLLSGTLALSGCSIYDLPLPGGADTGDDPIKITLIFRDVLDLVPQSTVKVDDVTVGKVTAISLKDYTAKVTIALPRDIDLPENLRAEIRQTSLLGEKFVSLTRPDSPTGKLGRGDVIGLDSTGRNPEVEEVFSALALLLNGGGVAQLKTISAELNNTFEGRETEIRSVITQLRAFMGQLDSNKGAIINTLENLNRLALQLRRQDKTIKLALDEIPSALQSVNSQRQDLVKMLQALDRLSGVGVRVIQASKASTIESLDSLAPVLTQFARAGQDFPKAFEVLLTYPFLDAAVGGTVQGAKDLRMGDFTNLAVRLDLDIANLPNIPGLPGGVSLAQLLEQCAESPATALCSQIDGIFGDAIAPQPTATPRSSSPRGGSLPAPTSPSGPLGGVLGGGSGGSGGSGDSGDPDSDSDSGSDSGSGGGLLGGLFSGLGRSATGFSDNRDPFLLGVRGVDPDLGTLLLQGVAYK